MDPPLFQQFKFVSLATYPVQYSKSSKELRFQLLIIFGFDIFTAQLNFLAGSIISRLSSFIVSSFLQFLSMLQVLSLCNYKIPKFFGQPISYFGPGAGVNVLFVENAWVVLAVELKKHISYANMVCVIISDLCYGQEPCSVVPFVINKSSKVNFYYAILLLSLAVGLRVKGGRMLLFYVQEVVQVRLKLEREY